MHFAHVSVLYLLYLIPLVVFLLFMTNALVKRRIRRFGDERLVEHLIESSSGRKKTIKSVCIVLALVFLIVSAAGPQWGTRIERISRKGIDIAFAIDVSESMLAEDVKPNRLEMAKREINEFLKRLSGDRVSLLAFAGESFIHCPPTLDYSAFKLFLDSVDTQMSPTPGTDYAEMIKETEKLFATSKGKHKVLVILSDGEDHSESSIDAAKRAYEQGISIYTIGIGTEAGVPIPLRSSGGDIEGYKKDREGKAVTTRLGEAYLQKIAISTGGVYARATASGDEVKDIVKNISKMEKEEFSSMIHSIYEEKYQYPLGIALLILLVESLISTRREEKKAWMGRIG